MPRRGGGVRWGIVVMFRSLLCVLSLWGVLAGPNLAAQGVSLPPPPLVVDVGPSPVSAAERMLAREAAQRALEFGFPSIAAGILRAQLVSADPADTVGRNRLVLDLATALLDDGKAADVEDVLRQYAGLPNARYRLRAALAAVRLRRWDVARVEIGAAPVADLPAAERGWHFYVQGQLADAGREFSKASAFYEQALGAAGTELQRARFILAREEARLVSGDFSEAQLATLRTFLERNPGRSAAYEAISQLALSLNGLGRRGEAMETLRRQLQALPPEQSGTADQWLLLLGLIAGPGDPVGRNALGQLLSGSADRDKQRVALVILARGAPPAAFRAELDRLIEAPTPHPILEDLLLQRAELALAAKAYADADRDAVRLLETFPGSRLKPQALGVRVRAAWETLRYRRAADYAIQTRAALGGDQGRLAAELGVLVAEAYFRAGDYLLASDAYAAAIAVPPDGFPVGDLIFQRVLCEVEAARADPARLTIAETLLDEGGRDPRLDPANRWQAEWNLARALQVAGPETTQRAFERIERLLAQPLAAAAAGVAPLTPDLRVRMAWLHARLSLDVGRPERTLTLVERLVASLQDVETRLRVELASSARLLEADAYLAIPGREEAGLDVLRRLRTEFPQSDAAVYSFIKEASFAAGQNRFVDAQSLLVRLADDFARHAYAPFALYQAALNAERRGQDAFYRDANRLIERLVQEYPKSDLVFYARLKQGDLLRRLNEFSFAQQAYEELINAFPKHPDVLYAHLARAACHAAQAGAGGSGQMTAHAETALGIYERLVDQADAAPEIRMEAGYNLGLLLSRKGRAEGRKRAETVWWQQVVTPFLLDSAQESKLSARGRYWLSRTLLGLGELFESQDRRDQATDAYQLLLRKGLPGGSLAQARLTRLGVKP